MNKQQYLHCCIPIIDTEFISLLDCLINLLIDFQFTLKWFGFIEIDHGHENRLTRKFDFICWSSNQLKCQFV